MEPGHRRDALRQLRGAGRGALAQVPGVREARVNLATERASVVVDPARVDVDRLAEAVARAGYSARRAEFEPGMGAEALRRERAEQVAYWRRRLVVGVALAVPLVVLGYAPMLAPCAWGHAAWVAWVMFALAAVLQAYLGGPYLKGAWRRLKQGSSNMDTLIALGTSTAFGFSVVQLLVGHAGPSRFLWGAAGVAIAVAISVAGAVLFGDPPRFAEGQSPGEPIETLRVAPGPMHHNIPCVGQVALGLDEDLEAGATSGWHARSLRRAWSAGRPRPSKSLGAGRCYQGICPYSSSTLPMTVTNVPSLAVPNLVAHPTRASRVLSDVQPSGSRSAASGWNRLI